MNLAGGQHMDEIGFSEWDSCDHHQRNSCDERVPILFMNRPITMKSGNKGLTVKVNLFSLNEYLSEFDSQMARLWMRGQVTHADTGEVEKFNDAGELVSILGRWNARKATYDF